MLNARDVCGVDRPRRFYYPINENSIERKKIDKALLMFCSSEGLILIFSKSKNITVLKLINFQEIEDKSYLLSSTGGPSEKVCTIGYF